MRLLAVGVSHHTAPVEVRERLAIPPSAVPGLLRDLRGDRLGDEAVVLSTCNRVEIYTVPTAGTDVQTVARWLVARKGLTSRRVEEHLYGYQQRDALRHLFRVASSLDSMIVGEPQILGQVKEAYRAAVAENVAGGTMHRVMDRALSCAKKVRTETGIGREAVSVGRAGVELARQVLDTLEGRSALLVGAGAHGKLVARSLLSYGLGELVVANRTFERAAGLAQSLQANAVQLDDMARALERVDVVVASTGAGRVLIDQMMLAPIVRRRRYRPLVMIDLAVPRNIDPAVNELEGVYRFDVDDLQEIASEGKQRRVAAAVEAEEVVERAVGEAWRALLAENIHADIGTVVTRADGIRKGELDRIANILERLDPREREAVEAMTRSIVKKVLHSPLSHARTLASEGERDRVQELLSALGAGDDDEA